MTVATALITPDSDRPRRIVLAEDDPDVRELVADCLRKEGYEVQEVSTGAELLVRIEDSLFLRRIPEQVDLFVTDINMPVYTGIEIITGLRDAGMHMPVIIMTAFASEETHAQAKALGAAFLHKPFDADQLRTLVRSVLSASPPSA